MNNNERPDYCCGKCPELLRGGYDCTCEGNPRCNKNATVSLQEVLDLDAQATEGPWESDVGEVSQHWSRPEPWQVIVSKEVDCGPYCYGGAARGIEKSEDAELIAHYRTAAPAMAKALQAVLDLHKTGAFYRFLDHCETPTEHQNQAAICAGSGDYVCPACPPNSYYCTSCRDEDGNNLPYPCPTAQTIYTLLGEQLA